MMDLHHTHTQYINNLNMATSSKPPLCGVIYVYCKSALPAVKNQEEVERSVRAYALMMQQQQQAYADGIVELVNKMCNQIGCSLKFYDNKILVFEDTSGAAVAAQRKVPFDDTSGAAAAAQQKVDKEASDVSSRAYK